MKITTILGSPRKKGNTAKVLGFVEEIVSQNHEVDRVNISDCEVRGCLGCGACQKMPHEPGCVQKDNAVSILERMIGADVVLYTSPLYCWGFASQMKALIDRHFCLVTGYGSENHTSLLEGKRTALLVTCGGPVENNADLIQQVFDRANQYCKAHVIGKHVVPFCTTPDLLGADAVEIAKKIANDIMQT